MRFGQSTAEQEAAMQDRGDSAFIKYLKKGDNTFQIVDEYDKWTWYWDHYNPGGFPFPCTNDRETCPGCTSDNEKMRKASRRAAFNAYDGEYTNVWKVPKTVAEKLKNRHDRLGTITDRPYRITQIQNDQGFYDYDIEGEAPAKLDMTEISKYLRDPEDLLAAAYDDAWGSSSKAATQSSPLASADRVAERQTGFKASEVQDEVAARRRPTIQRTEPVQEPVQEPEKVYSEAELRQMDAFGLLTLCDKEGLPEVPSDVKTTDEIVDWMLTQVS